VTEGPKQQKKFENCDYFGRYNYILGTFRLVKAEASITAHCPRT